VNARFGQLPARVTIEPVTAGNGTGSGYGAGFGDEFGEGLGGEGELGDAPDEEEPDDEEPDEDELDEPEPLVESNDAAAFCGNAAEPTDASDEGPTGSLSQATRSITQRAQTTPTERTLTIRHLQDPASTIRPTSLTNRSNRPATLRFRIAKGWKLLRSSQIELSCGRRAVSVSGAFLPAPQIRCRD